VSIGSKSWSPSGASTSGKFGWKAEEIFSIIKDRGHHDFGHTITYLQRGVNYLNCRSEFLVTSEMEGYNLPK
jgi:hypothetical protein